RRSGAVRREDQAGDLDDALDGQAVHAADDQAESQQRDEPAVHDADRHAANETVENMADDHGRLLRTRAPLERANRTALENTADIVPRRGAASAHSEETGGEMQETGVRSLKLS